MVSQLADENPRQDGNGTLSGAAAAALTDTVIKGFNESNGILASFGFNTLNSPAASVAKLQFPSNLGKYKMILQFSDYFRPSIFQSP